MKEGVRGVVKRHAHSIFVEEMPVSMGEGLEILSIVVKEMMMEEKGMVIEHHEC